MADCNTLKTEYDALVAADPQDPDAIEAKRQQMLANQCEDPQGSGGTGGIKPPHG